MHNLPVPSFNLSYTTYCIHKVLLSKIKGVTRHESPSNSATIAFDGAGAWQVMGLPPLGDSEVLLRSPTG